MLLTLLLVCCVGSAELTLDAETVTVGAVLRLPSSDARAALSLGRAPAPGLARRIPGYEVAGRIQAAGLSSEDLVIPGSILVRRKAESLDKEQVRRVVLDAFVRRFPEAQIELVQFDVPSLEVATGPVTLAASLPPRFDSNLPVFVRLDVRGASFARSVYVRALLRIQVIQPMIRTHVAANSEIQAEQVEWTMAPLDTNQTVASSFEDIKGMLAKRDLEPGQVLTPGVLYTPLYVRKGDTVVVRAVSGGVAIAATMRAKAAGRLGETISVEHLNGEGSTTSRIVGPRTLEAN
jgi:flagella basal body P-ring formation protein FlgA